MKIHQCDDNSWVWWKLIKQIEIDRFNTNAMGHFHKNSMLCQNLSHEQNYYYEDLDELR